MQNMPEEELMEKESALAAEVERLLPDFVNSCRDKADVVIIHQDAFAADYQDHEYALLGKAIKFAGLHGKEVRIIGKKGKRLKDRVDQHCGNKRIRSNRSGQRKRYGRGS
jgi:hypothetical protein